MFYCVISQEQTVLKFDISNDSNWVRLINERYDRRIIQTTHDSFTSSVCDGLMYSINFFVMYKYLKYQYYYICVRTTY